mgnify:CR=1 FL=1
MRRVLVLLLVCSLWGWGSTARAEVGVTADSVTVGVSNAQQGPAHFLGVELSRGARVYFNAVNAQGGVLGRQIKVVQYDDGYEPDSCIANTKHLLEKDKVFALINYVGTPTSKAVAPMIAAHNVPFFFPFTGAGFLRDMMLSPTVFNLRATYDMETEALVDYVIKQGKRRIAIFYQDDSYGRAGLSGTRLALERRDLPLAAAGTYLRNTTAVNQGLITILKAKPEAVIMIGTYLPCAEFIKRAVSLGMRDVTFLNISFVGSKALAQELGPLGDGVIVSQVVPLPWNADVPAVKEYQDMMRASFSTFEPEFVSLEGFLNAKLFVEILKRAGSDLTRQRVIQTAESISHLDLGLGPVISYTTQDHQGLKQVFLTVIKDGKFLSLER